MPIKPENLAKYPANWKAISLSIRERDGNKCKFCGVANGTYGYRDIKTGQFVSIDEIAEGAEWIDALDLSDRPIKIVLTVAHLDHNEANCEGSNLAALCQRCHLTYDAKHHAETARVTREKKQGLQSLFPNAEEETGSIRPAEPG